MQRCLTLGFGDIETMIPKIPFYIHSMGGGGISLYQVLARVWSECGSVRGQTHTTTSERVWQQLCKLNIYLPNDPAKHHPSAHTQENLLSRCNREHLQKCSEQPFLSSKNLETTKHPSMEDQMQKLVCSHHGLFNIQDK